MDGAVPASDVATARATSPKRLAAIRREPLQGIGGLWRRRWNHSRKHRKNGNQTETELKRFGTGVSIHDELLGARPPMIAALRSRGCVVA